ncbi:MAG: HAD family hydrolase [archaeon]|nr:HAD family hydrolase [archaeon]
MKKVIFFDFWGTLVENGIPSPIKQVKNALGIRLPFSEYVKRMESAMMTKNFSSLKEAFVAVCEEFEINPAEYLIDRLIGLWNKSWMLATLYEETEEVLAELQKDYQIVLVSNTDCVSIKSVFEKFPLKKYFTTIYLSCDLGNIKTDKEFLNTIMADLKIKAEDCIFVGDSILSDMVAAKNAGIDGILIDRKNSRDYEPKIASLRELKSLL